MATNLETLELTIQSNAQSAKKGIDDLITSLSSLPQAVNRSVRELTKLNDILLKVKKNSGHAMHGFSLGTFGMGKNKAGNATKPVTSAPNTLPGGWTQVPASQVPQNVKDSVLGTTNAMNQGATASTKFGEAVSNALSRINRIASTMITRMALKALIKNFSEAWKAAYNFSKKIGGDFAKNIDKVRGSLGAIATNIVKAFSPLMSIIAPIFSVIASGVEYLTQALNGLLKLLGMTSDLLGASTEKIASSANSTAKASKNVLAGFDELNVIDSSSGSGSGSGSGGSTFTAKFQEEIDAIKMIVAESLLAVGLILAFSGHVGIGLAMAAIGAATIVGTIVEKWGTISDKVKGEITQIMFIAGTAMLALGLILAFSCPAKAGLGIALIAAGAANMVAAVGLSWNLDDKVKQKISKIAAISGTAMLAIGAVLAFSGANIPLGIGMMIAGGVSLAAAVALNWDSLKGTILRVLGELKQGITEAWENIKKAIGDAWDQYMSWTGISWSEISGTWNSIKEGISDAWDTIKNHVYWAWGVVTNWISTKWADLGGWEGIKENLAKIWEDIQRAVYNAWGVAENWINATWDKLKTGWENIKTNLSDVWEQIKLKVYNAWGVVKNWIEMSWSKLQTAWNNIKSNLKNVWDNIGTYVSDAWENVKEWYKETSGSVIDKIKTAWKGVKTWFQTNITTPIGNFFKSMINAVIDAMNWAVDGLNDLGHIKWDAVSILGVEIIPAVDTRLYQIPKIPRLSLNAEGAYNIPKGQMFIANEAGAEMVGSLDGHTAVANQQQIIEGIRRGVADGQAEQNALLRRQNDILLGILEKEGTVRFGASAELGKVAKRSINMYNSLYGGA